MYTIFNKFAQKHLTRTRIASKWRMSIPRCEILLCYWLLSPDFITVSKSVGFYLVVSEITAILNKFDL